MCILRTYKDGKEEGLNEFITTGEISFTETRKRIPVCIQSYWGFEKMYQKFAAMKLRYLQVHIVHVVMAVILSPSLVGTTVLAVCIFAVDP